MFQYRLSEARRCHKEFFNGTITYHQYETVMSFLRMYYNEEVGDVREIDV